MIVIRRAGFAIRFFCFVLLPVVSLQSTARAFDFGHCFSGGCDVIWDLNQRFDDGVRSKSESLVGPAKQAFDDSTRILFEQRIGPAFDRIDQIMSGRLDQANKIIQDAEDRVSEIIDKAGKVAVEKSDQIVSSIRRQIIEETAADANALVDKINMDVLNIIDTVDCVVDGKSELLQSWVWSQVDFLPHPFNRCYVGFRFSTPTSDDLYSIYLIRRCEMVQDLDSSNTVSQLLDNYARLSVLARRYACAMRQTKAEQRVNEDVRSFGRSYDIWALTLK